MRLTSLTSLALEPLLTTAQALNGERSIGELLPKLAEVTCLHSGAETCSVLQSVPEGWMVYTAQAGQSSGKAQSELLSSEDRERLPFQLINYVQQTLCTISSSQSGTATSQFWRDDLYFALHQPPSFLCAPVRYQDRCYGLLYLEHQQTPKEDCSRTCQAMVTLFCQQTATVLENARLNDALALSAAACEASLGSMAVLEEGRFSHLNEGYAALFGYHVNDLMGKSWETLYSTQEIARLKTTALPIVEREGQWQGELVGQHQQGHRFVQAVTLSSLADGKLSWVCRDIRDRKQPDPTHQTSLSFMATVLNSIPDPVFVKDEHHRFVAVNDALCNLTGYSRETLIGKTDHDFFPSPEANVFWEKDEAIFRTGESSYNEEQITDSDGQVSTIATRKTLAQDAAGQKLLVGIIRDITSLKRATAELQESQQLLQLVMNTIPQALFWKDRHSTYLGANQAFAQDAGFSDPGLIVGKNDYDLPWTSEEADWYRTYDQRVMNNDCPELHIVETQLRADGRKTWLDTNKVPLHSPSGEVIGILGTYEDITERKEAEETLERQIKKERLLGEITNAIRQSLETEQIFQTTIQQVGQALQVCRCVIYTHDWQPSPRLIPVSEYCAAGLPSMLGQPILLSEHPHAARLLIQDHAVIFDHSDPRGSLPLKTSVWEAMQIQSMIWVRTSYLDSPNGVLMLHRCDGPHHWSQDEIDLIEAVAAQVGIALAQAQLLKQEQQQRQELEEAKQAADAASRAKSEFLASMSHELRTPLNAILGFSQLMQRDQGLSAQHQENLNTINRSGEHLLTLINDILEVSKIEAGQTTLTLTDLHVQTFLQSLQAMMQLKAQSKNLCLTFEYASNLPTYIQTDEVKLRQILINLLGNAIKFTDEGYVTLTVSALPTVDAHQPEQLWLRFSVKDSGAGIAPEEHEQLFQAFGQTETGRTSKQGTGLGLPISRKFAQMMKGDITVTSQVGQGSTFDCDIQVRVITTPTLKTDVPQKVIGLPPHQPRYRMLVVDDHEENRLLLVQLLQSVGFETCAAENGSLAVDLTRSWKPDLVWMDLRMPVMDGWEATHHIKMNPQAPPVIALTANAFKEDHDQALAVGCDDFVSKPFRESDIWQTIAHHLTVQYIYDESCCSEPEVPVDSLVTEISTVQLQNMPMDWLQALYQAATTLDSDRIDQLLTQLPAEQQLLQTQLKQIADSFDFDRLVTILDKTRPK